MTNLSVIDIIIKNINYILFSGDSGYALRPWLMTPVEGAELGTPESRYNTQHMLARNVVERLNGLLKNRYRCLLQDRTLHYHPSFAVRIINTCAILHNMCNSAGVVQPRLDTNLLDGIFPTTRLVANERQNIIEAGRDRRMRIINDFYAN